MAQITYAKLEDGEWGVRGAGLAPGAVVRVAKRDGSTQEETIDRIVRQGSDGLRWATIVRRSAGRPAERPAAARPASPEPAPPARRVSAEPRPQPAPPATRVPLAIQCQVRLGRVGRAADGSLVVPITLEIREGVAHPDAGQLFDDADPRAARIQ